MVRMTSTVTRAPEVEPAAPRRARGMRADIQGLRAIAVALVVLYHLWPWHIGGGFIGVDVFFVISGFLITSHLLREVDLTGTVSLPRFWARRARRLLPASLLVLAAVLVAIAWWVPRALWGQFAREVIGAAAYVENLLLAADSVDYLAASNAASPVQHYWSLSAEEQFYLLWPLLVVLAVWLGRRWGARRRAIAAMLALVTAGSFATSIAWTASSPAQAYFVTPTRAWEFGAGALLAVLPAVVGRARLRAVAAWAGLALIGLSAWVIDGATPFPGAWALLPVAGTVLVLWADGDHVRGAPSGLLRLSPVQTVGELSYSIYLWHWAAIVIAPYALHRDLQATDKLLLLVGIGLASYATWRWVENPARGARVLIEGRPRLTFAFAGAGMAVVIGAAAWMSSTVEREVESSLELSQRLAQAASDIAPGSAVQPPITADPSGVGSSVEAPAIQVVCIGAATVDPAGGCTSTLAAGEVVPVPAAAKLDSPEDCLGSKGSRDFDVCEFGVPRADSRGTVALVGDSHAYHWLPAMDDLAKAHGWHGVVMARASCPFTPADRTLDRRVVETCATFNERVAEEIARRDDITMVVMGAYQETRFAAPAGADERAYAQDSFRAAIDALPARVSDVYVIRDAPVPLADNVECVERELRGGSTDPGAGCAVPRGEGLQLDVLAAAAEQVQRATAIDLSDLYCDADACVPVVGNVMVYADQGHLTRTWVHSAVPQLERLMPAFSART